VRPGDEVVAGLSAFVAGVEHEEHRTLGQQRQLADDRLIPRADLDGACAAALVQGRGQPLEDRDLLLGSPVPGLRRLARLLQAALDELEVGEDELSLDVVGVGYGVELRPHVGHVGVLEGTQHVGHRVDAADVGEEAQAQPLAAGLAAHAGDVDHLDGRVDLLRRLEAVVQPVKAFVGHRDDAAVGLSGRVRGCRRVAERERVEQGRLATVGQTDDAEPHGLAVLSAAALLRHSTGRRR
jgi:hypothetical protein